MTCCCFKFKAAIAVFVFRVLSGMILCGGIFNWVYRLEPVNVWRPMSAPGLSYYAGTFITSVLFVLVYKLFSRSLEGMSKIKKGLIYGLCVWAVGILPGMVCTHIFMTVNNTVVIYWTLVALVLTPVEGMIAAFLVSDEAKGGETCCIKK